MTVMSGDCRGGAHAKCDMVTCDCPCHRSKRLVPGRPETAPPAHRTPRWPPQIEIAWEDPPPAKSRRTSADKFEAVLEELRLKPGIWARIAIYDAHTAAGTSRTILIKRHPDFEFVARRIPDGHSSLYARCRETE